MEKSFFTIRYEKTNRPGLATLDKECTAEELGEGLKDLCLYLRDMGPEEFDRHEADSGELFIYWEKLPHPGDYRDMPEQEITRKLQRMEDVLTHSEAISDRMKMSDFIIDDLNSTINQITLAFREEDRGQVMEQYKKKLDYLFGTIGRKLLPQNQVTVRHRGFTLPQIQQILSETYERIPEKDKKKFRYNVDFTGLVYDDLDDDE